MSRLYVILSIFFIPVSSACAVVNYDLHKTTWFIINIAEIGWFSCILAICVIRGVEPRR